MPVNDLEIIFRFIDVKQYRTVKHLSSLGNT